MAAGTLDAYDATFWPFGPNWKDGLQESLDWNTQVMGMLDGGEQRVQLRTRARRTQDYGFLESRSNARLLDRTLWGAQNKRLAMPVWQYKGRLTANALSGATALSFAHELLGVTAGSLVVLMTSETTWEAAEVVSLGSGVVNLTAPLADTWPAGTRVYPVLLCVVQGNVPLVRQTDQAISGHITVLGDPLLSDPFLPVADAPFTYNGYEILMVKPDWADGMDASQDYVFDQVDHDTGPIAFFETSDTPQPHRAYRWMMKTRQAVYDFRAFLNRRNGRQKAFYIPSWNDDFRLVTDIGSGATQIRVVDDGFVDFIGVDPARCHVMIRRTGGGYYLRQITAATKDGMDALLTINSALGAALTVADCKAIHLVSLYRLESDTVVLQWLTDEVAVSDAPVVLVKA
jgi:hypothetical protein